MRFQPIFLNWISISQPNSEVDRHKNSAIPYSGPHTWALAHYLLLLCGYSMTTEQVRQHENLYHCPISRKYWQRVGHIISLLSVMQKASTDPFGFKLLCESQTVVLGHLILTKSRHNLKRFVLAWFILFVTRFADLQLCCSDLMEAK